MELVLIEKRRQPDDDQYSWTPFEHDDRFNLDWWDRVDPYGDSETYVQVLLDDREVARGSRGRPRPGRSDGADPNGWASS